MLKISAESLRKAELLKEKSKDSSYVKLIRTDDPILIKEFGEKGPTSIEGLKELLQALTDSTEK